MALGHQGEIVPLGEEGERLLYTVDQLNRLRQDALAEGHHRAQVVLGDLALGQLLVTEAQVAAECSRAVAMDAEIGLLDLVEDGPRLFPRQRRMGQEIEEILDGPLEVNVVLPEGVVGVEDEVLAPLFSGTVAPCCPPAGLRFVACSTQVASTAGEPPRRQAVAQCYERVGQPVGSLKGTTDRAVGADSVDPA